MKKEGDIFSGLGEGEYAKSNISEGNENVRLPKQNQNEDVNTDNTGVEDKILNGIKIIPLGGNFTSLLEKRKFKEHFHHINFSLQSAHFLECKEIKSLLQTRNASVSVEGGKYIHPLTDDILKAQMEKILQLAQENGLRYDKQGIVSDESLLRFVT